MYLGSFHHAAIANSSMTEIRQLTYVDTQLNLALPPIAMPGPFRSLVAR